ncbi:hypothetical protein OOU_Y34scaffold00587g3 [Pyricularia oryzae Y34]|nr:hypothetical protein OOU_Y34scaffold00587g3 [Pyricularia oryzae Y34]
MPHRRGLAMGLTIGGSSIGGIVWPIMLQRLLNNNVLGFGWTMRAVAFTMMPLLAFACLAVREPPRKPASAPPAASAAVEADGRVPVSDNSDAAEPVPEKEVPSRTAFLRQLTYILLCSGLALAYLGLFTPLFYVSKYAIAQGQSTSTAFYLLSAVNASSFLGRVLPGYIADKFGHFNLLVLSTLLSGVVGFTWTQASSLPGLIMWALAYGFTSGAVMSLQNACASKMAPPQAQGLAVGVLMGVLSISALIGTPISGQILTRSGYVALSAWTGATLVAGGGVIGVARLLKYPKLMTAF